MPSRDDILGALANVQDPDLGKDIVSLGFVKNLEVKGGKVSFDLELTTPACPLKSELEKKCVDEVKKVAGVSEVRVHLTSRVRECEGRRESAISKSVKNVIAVASGKGGVGKSTVAANLAVLLGKSGAKAGLLDADIYGPSMPLMFGLKEEKPKIDASGKILPLEAHGIKLMSMGFLTQEDTPVIWRGPMVHKILQQFLQEVEWGELDYLVIDLPPGTGDAQLTLTQEAAISGAVIVTTPQEVSVIDARKGLKMFEKVGVPVLGIVENMSYYVCSGCGQREHLFRRGGGKQVAISLGVPFLGEIPVDSEVSDSGDSGIPVEVKNPDSPAAKALREMTGRVATELSIINMRMSSIAKERR